jgi:hypothetical protein
MTRQPLFCKYSTRIRPQASLALCILVATAALADISKRPAKESNGFSSPWRQMAISFAHSRSQTIPKIDHGYVLFSRRIIVNDIHQRDAIYMKSLAEGTEQRVPVSMNNAAVVWVNDLAIGKGDNLFLVGSLLKTAEGRPVNFLSRLDVTGHTLAVIDMGSYEPELACVEKDESIWTFGQDWDAERSDIPYQMLRNYSSTGQLLGSYLSSDALPPARLNFSTRLHSMGGTPGRIFLECGDQSVGTYIAPVRTWVEVSLADKTALTWRVNFPSRGYMTGLALLGSHTVYGSFKGWHSVFDQGFFKLDLNQSSVGTWEPVAGMVEYISLSKKAGPVTVVAGTDSSSIVYEKADSGGAVLFWVRP